jgi:hypothetical protein
MANVKQFKVDLETKKAEETAQKVGCPTGWWETPVTIPSLERMALFR